MSLILRRVLAVVLVAAGLCLLYAAFWVFSEVVWSQWKSTGWSVTGSSMILNHQWRGNEIYWLILLYLTLGSGMVAAGLLAWRRPGR